MSGPEPVPGLPGRGAEAGARRSRRPGRGGHARNRRQPLSAGALLGAVALHPQLWVAATAEALRLAHPGWWRRWPPLPLPDPALWRFRIETAYGGDGDAAPDPDDVRSFLRWCRDMHRWRKV